MTDQPLPKCPKCDSIYTYEVEDLYLCPECAYEWPQNDTSTEDNNDDLAIIKDSNGIILSDGDTITVIKDLKIKGSSSSVKVGTKVKNIRLCDGDHNIDCKISGVGAMKLKSEFVKKV
ncbi:MAG: alkylphosphonate utilization protein [Rickettsiales bacterium]|jgi:protein PhnA|nr:alkylphosphonate utilization protein [Rickettsiales bacterium]